MKLLLEQTLELHFLKKVLYINVYHLTHRNPFLIISHQLSFSSPSSICRSWPAAASFQPWTTRGTTTTCASSTITYRTSKLAAHQLNPTPSTGSVFWKTQEMKQILAAHHFIFDLDFFFFKRGFNHFFKVLFITAGVSAADIDVSLCTISQHVDSNMLVYVCCLHFTCCILYSL